MWNSQNLYTGWCDVPLTPLGEVEARTAGRLLDDNGFAFDVCHTSVLKRASFTANMALNMNDDDEGGFTDDEEAEQLAHVRAAAKRSAEMVSLF